MTRADQVRPDDRRQRLVERRPEHARLLLGASSAPRRPTANACRNELRMPGAESDSVPSRSNRTVCTGPSDLESQPVAGSVPWKTALPGPLLDEGGDADRAVLGGEQRREQAATRAAVPTQSDPSSPPSMAAFAARSASAGPLRQLRRHRERASRYTSAAGTTASTSPIASASSASTIRPVKIRSLALAGPISRGSRCVPPAPGMMPSKISGCPHLALSALIRKSAVSASSQPPPSA